MKLNEAIFEILRNQSEPHTFNEIARKFNNSELINHFDLKEIKSIQIKNIVNRQQSIFTNINGYVVLKQDSKWNSLLRTYFSLIDNTRGILDVSEQEFVVTALFFYKRLIDLNFVSLDIPIENISHDISQRIVHDEEDVEIWLRELKETEIRYDLNQNIFSDLSSILNRLRFFELRNIIKNITDLQTQNFSFEEYGKAFEYIIEIHQTENSKTNLIRTSREIIELMTSILDPVNASSIYDPVCGSGGFLSQSFRVNRNLHIYGSEINYRVAQIAQMNQIMNGDYNATIRAENCFDQLNNNTTYDLIVGDLPLSGISFNEIHLLSDLWHIDFPRKAKGFGAFILFSLSKLSNDGKAVFTVSDSFLFKSGIEQKIRKILLDLDYIEAIISLPNGVLKPYTNGKASILVLNKNKPNKLRNKVKFIVASNVFDASNLDVNEILEIYHQNKENSYSQVVEINEINKINTLDPNYYTYDFFEIRKLLVSGNARYLTELAIIKSGAKLQNKTDLNTKSGIPFVRIENLEREILDMQIDEKSIKDFVLYNPYYDRYIIDKECLLLAKIGENLKPTYFKPDQNGIQEIILHPNVIAVFPKSNQNLSLEFLYYQFYSDIVQNQINKRLSRSIVPFITLGKLRELIVPYVNLQSQGQIIEVEKAAIISAEKTRINERFKRLGYKEEAEERELNVVRTITHQLRHNLSGIEIMMDKLNRIAIKRNLSDFKEYDEDDPILVPKYGFEIPENNNIQEVIYKALNKARTLNIILLDVEKAINLNLTYSEVDLLSVFQKVQNENQNDCFTIDVVGGTVKIELSKTHFEDLINTLLENAKEHGFDKSKSNNKISFKIKPDFNRNIVEIEYQNNGKPLNINQKEYTSILTKSIDSNGSGIGGYYVNKIIEAHHGSLTLDESLKKGMKLVIELPLKQPEHE